MMYVPFMWDKDQKINRSQKVLTAEQYEKLVKNNDNRDQDHAPVVKFFNPVGAATWLLSELDPETGIAFGLCDLGMGEPELGSVSLDEIISMRGRLLGIERDLHFKGGHPMSWYVERAKEEGRIAV